MTNPSHFGIIPLEVICVGENSLAPMELDVKKTVKKSNLLNEVRNSNASLVEYRLFCVYLAHLKMSSNDNVVKFRLADYARICGLDRPRRTDLEAQANNIVAVTAQVDRPDGGFSVYNLFSEFRLFRENEEWMVSLECNSKIAPMIREQQGKFLRYKLYNTIYLKSYNQQRIYELLKQYQKLGVRVIDLADLRDFLSIGANEYPKWAIFARDVLKVAQKALKESTDICFDYEPIKKGRKVVQVKFLIYKNDSFIDQLNIDDFMPATVDDADLEGEAGLTVRAADPDQTSLFDDEPYLGDNVFELREDADLPSRDPDPDDPLGLFREALPPEMNHTDAEIEELIALARPHIPDDLLFDKDGRDLWVVDYLRKKVLRTKVASNGSSPKGFLRGAVEHDW